MPLLVDFMSHFQNECRIMIDWRNRPVFRPMVAFKRPGLGESIRRANLPAIAGCQILACLIPQLRFLSRIRGRFS